LPKPFNTAIDRPVSKLPEKRAILVIYQKKKVRRFLTSLFIIVLIFFFAEANCKPKVFVKWRLKIKAQ